MGPAVRRVVVTPTFAAGLGVVIAAGLVAPMTRNVTYTAGPPGLRCQHEGCVAPGAGAGILASASPGDRLLTPSKRPARSAGRTPHPHPAASGASGASGHGASSGSGVAAAKVTTMRYATLQQGDSGFIGKIVIAIPPGKATADWTLRFAYPDAHIVGVWGGQWTAVDAHTALVRPLDWQRATASQDGQEVEILFSAVGTPAGRPPSCSFDGAACHWR